VKLSATMNVKPTPSARLALSVAAVAVILVGTRYHDLRIWFASWAIFLVLTYIAGGGRRPSKIKFKDYLLYLLISLALVVGIFLYAWHGAHPPH
jgi:hypothetical protein